MLYLHAHSDLGSARVSRVGEGVLAFAHFRSFQQEETKFVVAGRADQHARRVRYP